MKASCKIFLFSLMSLLMGALNITHAREHQIYSIAQEIPMGYKDEIIKKNYYVNMGQNQGVSSGTVLDVYRIISILNPYDNQRRMNHRVKIGEIKVLHAEDDAAIGTLVKFENNSETPLFEIRNFMIGDHVSVSVRR